MEIGLDSLKVGQRGFVKCIEVDPLMTMRLRSFGFIKGTQVQCRYRTPCGNVAALEFCGTVVALRTRDIRNIRVLC